MDLPESQRVSKIVFVADYFPRQCGIATFTRDLVEGMKKTKRVQVDVVAMDDIPEGYPYDETVKFQVNDQNRDDYIRAAEFINMQGYDLCIVQHEFGIYGGEDGAYVLRLMRDLKMPIITTLHTVLENPSPGQRKVMEGIIEYSDRLVVMSQRAVKMLQNVFQIPEEMIRVIPHGIHDMPFGDPAFFKDQFGVERNKVILTFGLLGPSKGLENMIDAMPRIVEKHPDAVYLILGATHPHIVRHSGESYRQSLHQRARKLGVADHVIFHNRFVSTQLLLQYLSMADIYVTPYPRKEQITSGTLSYAVGAGKAVVSTPYWHAEELLADGRGVLVDFENPDALAQAIIWLLDNEFERNAIRKRAYNYSRHMVWEKVSLQYVNLGEEIAQQHASRPKPIRPRDPVDKLEDLPAPNLLHMRVLTDDNGILQHAYYTIPDRNHGYSLDDNARALIVSCLYYKQCPDDQFIPLIQTYLSFLHYAFNPGIGRFRNFMSYHRIWLEQCGSEDSHSRALWGLGVAVKTSPTESIRDVSARIFRDAIHACETFTSIRALAYAVVGCNAYLEVYSGDSIVRRIRNEISMRIFDAFKKYATEDWPWFEDKVTYANGIIPLALMLAGQWIPNLEMHAMGVKSLRWLLKIQTAEEGHLSVIGNQQWLTKGGIRAKFDQSPLEPMCLILACCQAYLSMQDPTWISEAQRCLDWYLGRNDLNLCLVSFKTGGCSNGLNPEGISPHQGAEATLSWLISLLSVRELISRQPPSGPSGT